MLKNNGISQFIAPDQIYAIQALIEESIKKCLLSSSEYVKVENLITPDVLAKRWGIATKTLSHWRWSGKGPEYRKRENRVLYAIDVVEAFEKKMVRHHTADPGFLVR